MATIADLKTILDLYGVGVRAGALTPQTEDEAYLRKLIDLPEMSQAVLEAWEDEGGIRRPITLASGSIQVATGEIDGGDGDAS